MVDVAQLVRAPVCGTGGRGFKSRHPPHMIFPNDIFIGDFFGFCTACQIRQANICNQNAGNARNRPACGTTGQIILLLAIWKNPYACIVRTIPSLRLKFPDA